MLETYKKEFIAYLKHALSLYKYNSGRQVSMKEILANPHLAAKEFAEGNQALEKLLLYCYQHGIETLACCGGHRPSSKAPRNYRFCNYGENDYCYILLKENNYNSTYINSLLGQLYNYDNIEITFLENRNCYIY